MIKILTTLRKPTSGTARICGFDIVKNPSDVRRMIGYVPQMVSADAGERQPRAKEALEFMNLSDVGD